MKTTRTQIPPADLSQLDLLRKVDVKTAASLNDVSEGTFKKHYGHLIHKFGPRRNLVTLRDAIELPPPQAKTA